MWNRKIFNVGVDVENWFNTWWDRCCCCCFALVLLGVFLFYFILSTPTVCQLTEWKMSAHFEMNVSIWKFAIAVCVFVFGFFPLVKRCSNVLILMKLVLLLWDVFSLWFIWNAHVALATSNFRSEAVLVISYYQAILWIKPLENVKFSI